MHLSDISNIYAIDVEFIRGNPNWKKFVNELKSKCENVKEPHEIYKFIDTNRYTIEALKEDNQAMWNETIPALWKLAHKTAIKEGFWSQPRSKSDVNYVLNLIKNGILVEDASAKLYDTMGYEALYEQIEQQKEFMPKSNFADTLANFIVKLEPKNSGIKKMQDAILHDPELSAMVLTPLLEPKKVKESIEETTNLDLDLAAKRLHQDLTELKQLDKLNSENAKTKLYIRSTRIQTHPDNLKKHYLKMFKKDALMWNDHMIESAFELYTKINEAKQAGTYDKIAEIELLMKQAVKSRVDSDQLQLIVVEMFESEEKKYKNQKVIKPIKEKAHKLTLNRLYQAGETMLKAEAAKTFGRKQPEKPQKPHNHIECFNCDGSGEIPGKWDSRCPICHGKGYVGENVNWKVDEDWLQETTNQLIEEAANGKDWYDFATTQAWNYSQNSDHNPDAYSWAFENLIYRAWQNKLLSEDEINHIEWYKYINEQLKEKGSDIFEELARQYALTKKNYGKAFLFAWEALNYRANKLGILKEYKPVSTGDIKIRQEIDAFATKVKNMVDNHDMSNAGIRERLIELVEKHIEEQPGYARLFPLIFKEITGKDFIEYVENKAEGVQEDVIDFEKAKKQLKPETPKTIPDETPSGKQRLSDRIYAKAKDIKVYIDMQAKEGKIKNWHDASNLLVKIMNSINKDFDGYQLEHIRDEVFGAFLEDNDEGFYSYIEKAARESGHFHDDSVNEDVVPNENVELVRSVKAIKKLIDKTPIRNDRELEQIFDLVEAEEKRLGINYETYSAEFRKYFDSALSSYVFAKHENDFRKSWIGEDVVDFPNRKELLLDRLANWAYELIMQTPIPSQHESEELKNTIMKKVKDSHINPKDFDDHFRDNFSVGVLNTITLKRLEDANAAGDVHRFEGMMEEGISHHSAAKCRNGLYRFLKRLTDSSNIAMLSNFESYEGKDKISLKMNVYERSPKKLEKIIHRLREYFDKDGWMSSSKDGNNKFIKGDINDGVMVNISPIKKTFRSGPNKNKELPTLGIEILGSKRVPLINK